MEKKQEAQERGAEWISVAEKGIAGMTPADKGWILAFVTLFTIFQISNFLIAKDKQDGQVAQMEQLTEYFNKLEESRQIVEENRAQEIRRLQEVVKELSQALGRQHEYQGRARHEAQLIEKRSKKNGN